MCSLISTLKPEHQSLLQAYLPSSKHDHRTMMHFLPHIFLHSLIEGTPSDRDKIMKEIMCVINTFNAKRELDQKLLNVSSNNKIC